MIFAAHVLLYGKGFFNIPEALEVRPALTAPLDRLFQTSLPLSIQRVPGCQLSYFVSIGQAFFIQSSLLLMAKGFADTPEAFKVGIVRKPL